MVTKSFLIAEMSTSGFACLLVCMFAEFGVSFHHNLVITISEVPNAGTSSRQVLCYASNVHISDNKKFFEIGVGGVDMDPNVESRSKISFEVLSTLRNNSIQFEKRNYIAQIVTQLGQGANVKVWKTVNNFSASMDTKSKRLRIYYAKLDGFVYQAPEIAENVIWFQGPVPVHVPSFIIIYQAGYPEEIILNETIFRVNQVDGIAFQDDFPLMTITRADKFSSLLHTLLATITSPPTPCSVFVAKSTETGSVDLANVFQISVMGSYFEPMSLTGELEFAFRPSNMVVRIERECPGKPKQIVKVLATGIVQEYQRKLIFKSTSIMRLEESKASRKWSVPKEFESLEGILSLRDDWPDAKIYLTYITREESMFGSAMLTPEKAWHRVVQIVPLTTEAHVFDESAEPQSVHVMNYKYMGRGKFWA